MKKEAIIAKIQACIKDSEDGEEYFVRKGNFRMGYFHLGYADGLRKALSMIIQLDKVEKEAAMPASTAADPQ